MGIDTTIRFNDHNSYKITTDLLGYPFAVQDITHVTHSFQAYATAGLAQATRAKTLFFDADGAKLSEVSHGFAVTTIFEKVEITVAVPATAMQAQLMLIRGSSDWWIAEPKSEQGEISTPFNVNYAGQMTYITPNGVYTGFIATHQIVVSGTASNPDETLETRLVSINQNAINVSATVSALDGTVSGFDTRITTIEAGQITLSDTLAQKTTKITSAGIYTGDVVATQVKTGKMSSVSGATYFNLDTNEIYMNGGAKGRIQISPTAGFKMMDSAGNQIGGLINIGGQLVSMATRLTNNSNPNFWATIGDDVIYGKPLSGIFGYTKLDTLNPAFKILGGQVNTGPDAGNYGIFTSKNEKSLITTYEYQNIGRVFLEAFGASGEYGKMEFTGYGMDMTFPQYYFSIDAYGIWHGKDVVFNYKVPMQQVGTVHNISSAASTAVTFPIPFPAGSAVKVIATPTTTATGVISPKVFNESPTGFSVVIGGSGFSGISFNWIAAVA